LFSASPGIDLHGHSPHHGGALLRTNDHIDRLVLCEDANRTYQVEHPVLRMPEQG
jgi:hypothetical protein